MSEITVRKARGPIQSFKKLIKIFLDIPEFLPQERFLWSWATASYCHPHCPTSFQVQQKTLRSELDSGVSLAMISFLSLLPSLRLLRVPFPCNPSSSPLASHSQETGRYLPRSLDSCVSTAQGNVCRATDLLPGTQCVIRTFPEWVGWELY